MEQYLDRVTDAYHGKLGPMMAQKTRDRVHWIIKNAYGEDILDVGCSQGLVSILLAREGKNVTGIDIAKEAIEYANASLEKEFENTRELVQFKQGNFLYETFPEQHFDTVIVTEVLEHFVSSSNILKKVDAILKPKGRIIITVPYGINDFPDHKRTLYLMEIYKEMIPYFKVEHVEFMGKWIGFIGIKDEVNDEIIPEKLFIKAEKAFFNIERELIDKNNKLKEQVAKFKPQIEEYKKKEKDAIADAKENREKIQLLTKHVEKLEKQLFAAEERNVKQKNDYENDISELKRKLGEKDSVIKGLQTDSNRMQEKISIMIQNATKDKDELEKNITKLKDINKKLAIQLEEKETTIGALRVENSTLTEVNNQNKRLQDEINELKNSFNEQLRVKKDKIDTLVQENKVLTETNIQLKQEKEESINNHLDELNKIEKLLKDQVTKESQKTESLNKKIKSLEDVIEFEKENNKKEKQNLELLMKDKENNIKILNGQILSLKRDMHRDEKEFKENEYELKQELSDLLDDLEKTTKQLINVEKEKEKLKTKYNSLRNSKLGKLTVKYWSLRKK